jgi:hypothetical protein
VFVRPVWIDLISEIVDIEYSHFIVVEDVIVVFEQDPIKL